MPIFQKTPDQGGVRQKTGWHVGGHNAWLHGLVGAQATAYVIDPFRSGAVAERIFRSDSPVAVTADAVEAAIRFDFSSMRMAA